MEIASLCEGAYENGNASVGSSDAAAQQSDQRTRNRGVSAEVQRLAVMSLAHFGAHQDSARMLVATGALPILARISGSDVHARNLRKDAASAFAVIRDNSTLAECYQ